jgi:hypothetical protein
MWRVLEERDRRYEQRFAAQERALDLAARGRLDVRALLVVIVGFGIGVAGLAVAVWR